MKSSSVALDRVIYRILMEEEVGAFTIMELRDRYLEQVDPRDVSLPKLRVYIYDHIRRMVNCGWVRYHEEKKTRGQRFVLLSKPQKLKVKLTPPARGMQERDLEKAQPSVTEIATDAPVATSAHTERGQADVDQVLQALKQAQLDFLSSYGEAEEYVLVE
ncbi:hypothetical protein [Oceanobacter mangrovi]|uniref:hypothetical protein n=1 Tax=Oceanobacter mangrovi TaxID=2862510 RepID=UPI001C8DAF1F|nr:hypothetical protein [Oceanobacter mangrovi]